MKPACLGLRAHSGWAALVAVGGDARSPAVVLRERIEMAEGPGSRQPYHAAESLELPEARRLLRGFTDSAARMARRALSRAVRDLRELGYEPGTAGILQAAGRVPKDLAAVLSSHALIHAADGQHFRQALGRACAAAGLAMVQVPEAELPTLAAGALGKPAAGLQREVASWGRPLGPPWTADQKLSALLAWMLLVN